VALKCLVDNIAIHAVELILIQQLEGVLSSQYIMEMSPGLIEKIASESPSTTAQRELLLRKLEVLLGGMEVCRRYTSRVTAGI
jgi:hypothetical protein